MNLPDELAAESMRQLLLCMRELPYDADAKQRLPLVNEASRLLERTTTKLNTVTRLGDQPLGVAACGDTNRDQADGLASPLATPNRLETV